MMTQAGKKCRSCVALASGNAGIDGLQMTIGIGFAAIIGILTGNWWVLWFIWAVIGAKLGERKGCPRWGAFLGFILGPIGLILIHYDLGLRGLLATFTILGAIGWFVIAMVKEQEQKRRQDAARADDAHKSRMEALDRESEDNARERRAADDQRHEADELARQTRMWERLPKWDRFGKPINRVPPGTAAVALTPATPTPPPDPAQLAQRAAEQRQRENVEILRKYAVPSSARR